MTRKEILEEKKISGPGIKFDFDLIPQEKAMVKDSVLDTCSSLEFTVNLIKKMQGNKPRQWLLWLQSCFFLGDLKRFYDALPNSDYWKVTQAAKNNGDLLTKNINLVQPKYLAKSQESSDLMVNELD